MWCSGTSLIFDMIFMKLLDYKNLYKLNYMYILCLIVMIAMDVVKILQHKST